MGYRPKPFRILDLEFDDPELEGLEVKMRSVSVKEQISLDAGTLTNAQLIDLMADRMVSWNVLDDNGIVMPIVRDSLVELGFDFAGDILRAWRRAIVGIKLDLGKESSNGDNLMEESMPMESL
jgi:hypothetical protein